ncbi:putative DNA binding protein [Zostera marina]|uniref:Putative DNA binding protein n=1 Tax=Zostera marina TaxID=29655 RepID=A0A0K9NZD4_ZOSMR|nr:putative DNA binding protein [Zostera marina]
MVSREQKQKKKVNLHDKFEILRSVTNSEAVDKASLIVDTAKYIQELKQKVEKLNEDIAYIKNRSGENDPIVTVKTSDKGFAINVFSVKSSPDTFCLEAFGGENQVESVDVLVVKQAVLQALSNLQGR